MAEKVVIDELPEWVFFLYGKVPCGADCSVEDCGPGSFRPDDAGQRKIAKLEAVNPKNGSALGSANLCAVLIKVLAAGGFTAPKKLSPSLITAVLQNKQYGTRDQTGMAVRGAVDDFFASPNSRGTDHYRPQIAPTYREPCGAVASWCVRK
jgi:hypothetical protein